MHTLKLENLTVEIDNKIILKDFNLEIKSGEIHVIMGPNGVGKSTLAKVIMGDPNYIITKGEISYDDILLNYLTTDKRANLGLFLGMQYPLEIEGVTNADLLRTAVHIKKDKDFKLFEFVKELEANVEKLKMDKEMIHRDVNSGFSGGERKKNEILQMYLIKPTMVVLDEVDSGLDIDSLKLIGTKVTEYVKKEKAGLLIITHYQRLLDYIKPDFVHIIKDGEIIKSGDSSIAIEIEKLGYDKVIKNTCLVKDIINE